MALLALAPSASAELRTQSFDSFAAGQRITTEVPGVSFPGGKEVFAPANTTTQTPPNALRTCAGCGPRPAHELEMRFDPPVRSVSVRAGLDSQRASLEFGTYARIVGYDASGQFVASSNDVLIGSHGLFAPIRQELSMEDAGGQHRIASAVVFVGQGTARSNVGEPRRAEIDELRYLDPSGDQPPLPDPKGAPSITITDPRGGDFVANTSVAVSGVVERPDELSAFCVRRGRQAEGIPADCNDQNRIYDNGRFVDVPVEGLTPGINEITAYARDTGNRASSTTETVNVVGEAHNLDLRIANMEITQGPGPMNLPGVDVDSAGGRSANYNGVTLVERGKTIVRVWADIASGVGAPGLRGVPVTLLGARVSGVGSELLGRLTPDYSPDRLMPGDGIVSTAERFNPRSAYTFTLPASWAREGLVLTASVNPASLAGAFRECATCAGNNVFLLGGMPFVTVPPLRISPVEMPWGPRGGTGDPGRDGDEYRLLGHAAALLPLQTDGLYVNRYLASLDVTQIAQSCGPAAPAVGDCVVPNDPGFNLVNKLFWWANGVRPRGEPYGITRALAGRAIGARAVGESDRPLVSLTHELAHLFASFSHADTACGGGAAPAFWPDPRGTIQGVALDRRPASGGAAGLYRILQPGQPNPMSEYHDLLSYCGSDSSSWISPLNWDRARDRLAMGWSPGGYLPTPRAKLAAAQDGGGSVEVVGSVNLADAATNVVGVRESPNPPTPEGDANHRLVARNAAGAVVASVPAQLDLPSGSAGQASGTGMLTGRVPRGDVASVEFTRGDEKVAERKRSATPPKVTISEPDAGELIGPTGSFRPSWTASDADGDPVSAVVEFSDDGGSTWRALTVGAQNGRATLPADLLNRTRRGRLRVTVNDGFNETAVVSPVFRTAGPRPEAQILSPAPKSRVPADSTLLLQGAASGGDLQPITGKRLRWLLGKRRIASGETASVTGLPPGKHTLTLEARDRFGQVTRRSMRLTVDAVTPRLIGPLLPDRLSPQAKKLSVRVGATVPSTLTIGRKRFAVGPKLRKVTVAIKPLPSTLTLSFKLAAGKRRATVPVIVPRG